MQTKDKKRIGFFKTQCSKAHFEFVKKNNGADEYCNKEDTRLEGPWSFGVRPARRDKKGDVARRNREIIEMGVAAAVDAGLVDVCKYRSVRQSVDLYKIDRQCALSTESTRGVWIWGPPGVGKSHYARVHYPDLFVKPQSKWFDGYTGQAAILLDDHDNPCLGHYLKIWADKYACSGEVKGGTLPLLHRTFVVTSNYSIRGLYKDAGEEMIAAIERRFESILMENRTQ